MVLPKQFLEIMKNDMKDEFDSFISSYEKQVAKGLRVNTLKISIDEFKKISPFALRSVPWSEEGFYVDEEKIGRHPYHFAGLYYSQEVSAMSAVPLLNVNKGERVLDLCSAPGGKGTYLAQFLQGTGLLVLNEKVSKRAKILQENVERMGIKNAVVLNEETHILANKFPSYFDKILVDAPCSGEGMFKKEREAIDNWSIENVKLCAERQLKILNDASKMLKVGGKIVYSTCTFAKEEDEMLIEKFLQENKNFQLCKLPTFKGWKYFDIGMAKLYPHKIEGEGHFLALLTKTDEVEQGSAVKEFFFRTDRTANKLFEEFADKFFITKPDLNIYQSNGVLYSLPQDMFEFRDLHLIRAGVKLGELVNGRFEPSHNLATILKPCECKNVSNYNTIEIEKYLKGEVMESRCQNGWCLVCVDGFSMGLGKVSGNTYNEFNGVVKNHYPKALRLVK